MFTIKARPSGCSITSKRIEMIYMLNLVEAVIFGFVEYRLLHPKRAWQYTFQSDVG